MGRWGQGGVCATVPVACPYCDPGILDTCKALHAVHRTRAVLSKNLIYMEISKCLYTAHCGCW
jgi:hypothetical protein